MKSWCTSIAILVCLHCGAQAASVPRPLISGLVNPESVCYGPKGVLYVTEIGEPNKEGDGKVTAIENGAARTLASALDDPKGIVFCKDNFYVTDRTKVVKVDLQGVVSDYATPDQFPTTPLFLNDIAIDNQAGIFLVSDSGDRKAGGGAVYWIDIRLNKITKIADQKTIPELHTPNGVAFEGSSAAIIADIATGSLYRARTSDRTAAKIASGLDGCDGLVWDDFGPSISGGLVYRGSTLPELDRAYIIYGDYVSNRIWALRFDHKPGRVVANQLIKGTGLPIMSFGEDDRGEIHALGASIAGRGIHRMVRVKQP